MRQFAHQTTTIIRNQTFRPVVVANHDVNFRKRRRGIEPQRNDLSPWIFLVSEDDCEFVSGRIFPLDAGVRKTALKKT
ncbi:MAG: hypothetical protein RMM53_07350, partial [Bacteroidia bacterium]|nr:hypothetical protein [Bacteroidia bacterium]MDW8334014.1 hypothetical protein [Bacteroidia bacterium]